MESFVIPISTVFAAMIAFVANYFTVNKKLSSLEEKILAEQKSNTQLIEEIKDLRNMKNDVSIQEEKVTTLQNDIIELKKLQKAVSELEKSVIRMDTKVDLKFDQILNKLEKIK